MNNERAEEQARALLFVCLAFLQDTDPDRATAEISLACCAPLIDVGEERLRTLAEGQVHAISAPGRWCLFLEAVHFLRADCGDDQLNRFIEQLMQLSLSDNLYAHDENRLIFLLGRIWDVHAGIEDNGDSWSILTRMDGLGQDDWSPVHDLAVLYLGLAHRTDSVLAAEEVDAVNRKLAEWLPESLPVEVNRIVNDALSAYSASNHDAMLNHALASVQRSVPEHQRKAVLSDLMFIARADRIVLVEERELIVRLAEAWSIDPSTIT